MFNRGFHFSSVLFCVISSALFSLATPPPLRPPLPIPPLHSSLPSVLLEFVLLHFIALMDDQMMINEFCGAHGFSIIPLRFFYIAVLHNTHGGFSLSGWHQGRNIISTTRLQRNRRRKNASAIRAANSRNKGIYDRAGICYSFYLEVMCQWFSCFSHIKTEIDEKCLRV